MQKALDITLLNIVIILRKVKTQQKRKKNIVQYMEKVL